MKKVCRIVAFDPVQGQVVMDLFAELSDKELQRTAAALEKLVIKGLLRGYRAEVWKEMRQLHVLTLLMPAVKAELADLERLMRRLVRPELSGSYQKPGPKDWSPIDEVTQHIAEEVARTLFVTAWVDYREEHGDSFSGVELFDVAPETPAYVFRDAMDLVRNMERLNHMPMRDMYQQALERAELIDAPDIRDDFGFLTAMQAMGHGVSWADDYKPHGLKIPHTEFSQYNLKEEDLEAE